MFGKKKKKEAAPEEGVEDTKDDKKEKKEAATGEEGEEVAEGEAEPKKSKKKLFIIIGAVVLLAGGGAGAYFAGLFGGHEPAAEGAETQAHAAAKPAGPTVFMELPEFLVNLNTASRQSSFLKMTIALELPTEADKAAVEANMPKIMDTFNTYLRELRSSDLYGSAGIYRLREELLGRINKIIAPAQVKDILFKQVLVQ